MIVDARGDRCPMPIIRLARAAAGANPGTAVTVLWTDAAARHDIAAWARMRGHRVVGEEVAEPADGHQAWATTVLLGGAGTTTAATLR
ncbi:sulfurtransferase TusA family protein [Isoptericola sp. b441]|uniref:Sulfurtransferase TusA family protein n=1 Tax=Actinotalea lenta TaxID=3064654 RepID=A0ABT9DF07_9CELL|nr:MULTISPECIES: sulfurtransferase TusA family protein [unclassified Isoptericola]MDO8107967.1 sulfurtransferase TusA family protein [Isoptericola sp. b441]MDO8120366.1 sulfurtransferase TusA family protein [Isoptericola sp. b490]